MSCVGVMRRVRKSNRLLIVLGKEIALAGLVKDSHRSMADFLKTFLREKSKMITQDGVEVAGVSNEEYALILVASMEIL